MRSADRALPRPIPMLAGALAALLLLLAACTGDAGSSTATSASAEPSSGASAEGSTAASADASADESAEASEDDDGQRVTITGTSFGVAEMTVSAGDTVRFINDSGFPHTVTEGQNGNAASDPRFNENVAAGEWVEVTFDEAGDVNVTCLFHSNMNMVVHVE